MIGWGDVFEGLGKLGRRVRAGRDNESEGAEETGRIGETGDANRPDRAVRNGEASRKGKLQAGGPTRQPARTGATGRTARVGTNVRTERVETFDHPRLGEVTLAQSPRARRVSIRVQGTGAVRLSYPFGVSRRRALEFLEEKIAWILAARERMARKRAALPPQLPPAERKARIEELRRAAKADLPERIARLSAETGLRYEKLSIRASRTKWGSCSGRNHISLSLFLMTLPEPLRDFVILHELCHTVHHNHSERFHALLDRLTGGREKELNRELRRYAIL